MVLSVFDTLGVRIQAVDFAENKFPPRGGVRLVVKWRGGVSELCVDAITHISMANNPYLPFPGEGIALAFIFANPTPLLYLHNG